MKADSAVEIPIEDRPVNVKHILSSLWIAIMFLFIYVDFFALFEPGSLEDIMAGIVWEFEISQIWALSAMVLMAIPSLMIFLSLSLPATINRWLNIIIGALYMVVVIGSAVGETWAYYLLGSILEFVLLALIVVYAWRWPRAEA